jgi:hypothetical protein
MTFVVALEIDAEDIREAGKIAEAIACDSEAAIMFVMTVDEFNSMHLEESH